jgi:SAM-dependent methyltransferase
MSVLAGLTETVLRYAVCPDDGGQLLAGKVQLCCQNCGRRFENTADSIWDFRPSRTFEQLTEKYEAKYLQLSRSSSQGDEQNVLPWGAPEILPAQALKRKLSHVDVVRSQLVASPAGLVKAVLCDFSGAAGHYTLPFARHVDWVIHCDLDPSALTYTARKARKLGIENILFFRIDYFQPPFAHTLDYAMCFDTLIRGPEHEHSLLTAIRRSLKPGGHAVIDFHNWWHNPLRRLGLLSQNFGSNRSYSRQEAINLLKRAEFDVHHYTPYRQEDLPGWLLPFIPPTRLLFQVIDAAARTHHS